nr:unnamed protein product [Digitaria exilis]
MRALPRTEHHGEASQATCAYASRCMRPPLIHMCVARGARTAPRPSPCRPPPPPCCTGAVGLAPAEEYWKRKG